MQLSMSAAYDKNTDAVEVAFYKHSSGNVVPHTSGDITLKQNDEVLSSIPITSQSTSVSFFHPKTLKNLTISGNVDTLTQDIQVETNIQPLYTPVAHAQQQESDDSVMRFKKPEVPIDTTKPIESPIILDLDFNFTSVPVEYRGGNRVLFSYSNKIVQQPLDTLIYAPKYVEVGATNLLPMNSDQMPDLPNLFTCTYPNSIANMKLVSDFGVPSLRISSLGGTSGTHLAARRLTVSLTNPVLNGQTIQFFFGFLRQPTPTTFKFITELLDATDAVVGSDVQVHNVTDFLNSVALLASTPTGVGGVKLTSRIEIDGLYALDTFDLDVLLPQVTALPYVTSYTDNIRAPDVFSHDLGLDYEACVVEMGLVAGSDKPCTLFDCGSAKAYYNGVALIFNINGTMISYPVSLTAYFNYSFSYDKDADQMAILIDDVPVVTGGAGFTITGNSKMYIGCDSTGNNQINGQVNRFRVMH